MKCPGTLLPRKSVGWPGRLFDEFDGCVFTMHPDTDVSGSSEPRQVSSSSTQGKGCALAPPKTGPAESSPAGAVHLMSLPAAAGRPIAPGADAILRQNYRGLMQHYLRRLPALFTKFTGLFSHLTWMPTWPRRPRAQTLPTRSRLCREVVVGCPETLAACRRCAARHLSLTLESGHKGHRFTCFKQVHNFWLPVIIRGCLVGLAFIQAPALPTAGAPAGHSPLRAHWSATVSAPPGRTRCSGRGTKRMSRRDFGQAARLLKLVIQHVETSAVAELRKSDLGRAQEALLELQTVATRLRTELNGLVPAFNKNSPALQPHNHADRLVQAALDYIHRHYSEPFTLQQYAGRLRMNAAYLSAQFSRAVGIPFKTYLTEVRLEKARELLSDPSRGVAEVAYAVGYASENRFRLAFKSLTGLSPRRWRETLQMEPGGS